MKLIIAPDSFKNCLSASQVAGAIARGIKQKLPECTCIELPLADGGEGTCEAMAAFSGGKIIRINAHDPLMRPVEAFYGDLGSGRAVMEMAAASGIEHLKKDELSAGKATSFGAGEVLAQLLKKGFHDFIIGIGGSASTDGGAGFLQAMGVKFFDASGNLLPDGIGGSMLDRIHAIDSSSLNRLPENFSLRIACDVNNPLTGKNGSAYIFSPQKGASPDEVEQLDRGLKHFLNVCISAGISSGEQPGDGAAGGLGFALRNFLKGRIHSGAKLVIGLSGLEEQLADADAVITGEGRTDGQTGGGKLCYTVAETAARHGKKTILVSGAIDGERDKLSETYAVFMSISHGAITLDEALKHARENLILAGMNIAELLKIGRHAGQN